MAGGAVRAGRLHRAPATIALRAAAAVMAVAGTVGRDGEGPARPRRPAGRAMAVAGVVGRDRGGRAHPEIGGAVAGFVCGGSACRHVAGAWVVDGPSDGCGGAKARSDTGRAGEAPAAVSAPASAPFMESVAAAVNPAARSVDMGTN